MTPPSRSPTDTSVVEATTDTPYLPFIDTTADDTSNPPFPPVQLGASDIDAIVKALLPPLAPLSKLTNEQLYVGLFTQISKLALNKTFSNNDELASLVQDISKQVVNPDSDPNSCLFCIPGEGGPCITCFLFN